MKEHQWFEVLPAPYNEDVPVVVVMIPAGWNTGLLETKDGKFNLACAISPKGNYLGLQVVDTQLTTWLDHERVFAQYKVTMADPAYIGPLSSVPDDLLHNADRTPWLFCRDAMWRGPVDLKRVWKPAELKC